MSVTAVGPALAIDGPLPLAPPHSLLNTEGVVVDRDGGRWLNGVNIYGYPDDTPSLWEPCSDGTFRTKSEGTGAPQPRFDPFVIYLPVTCSTISVGGDPEEFANRAEQVLEATASMGVEEALAAGVVGSTNPFFGDANVDLPAGATAQSAGVALSYLEEAIGATGRGGMIHATPAVIAALQAFPTGNEGDPMLITANGTSVVSGDGYMGVDTPFLASPGATQDWIFATGPVEVRLGPMVITEVRDSIDHLDNTLTYRAERYVLAVWDTALQAAVLVDWST